MPRSKATTIELDEAITGYVLRGELSERRVHGDLVRRGLITTREDGTFTVSIKTIGRRIAEFTAQDVSSPWSFANADPDDARLVLDVVADEFFSHVGRVWVSKDLAVHIARVRKAVSDIPPEWAYGLARAYQLCTEQERDSRHLDFALGVRPWRNAFAADRLARALDRPRSFRVKDDASGPLDEISSREVLYTLVAFQGSIDDMRASLQAELNSESIPTPPDIIVAGSWRDPLAAPAPALQRHRT